MEARRKKKSSNVVSSALGYLGSFRFYKDSGLNDRSLCKMDVRKRTPSVGNLSRNSTSLNAPSLSPPTPPVFLKISFARKRERSFISYSFLFFPFIIFLLLYFWHRCYKLMTGKRNPICIDMTVKRRKKNS